MVDFKYLVFRNRNISRTDWRYGSHISRVHDSLLKRVLRGEKYLKLYSYHYLINGFAVLVTPQQVQHHSRITVLINLSYFYILYLTCSSVHKMLLP